MLLLTLLFGLTASLYYAYPELGSKAPWFQALRPMHVTAAVCWILLGATACVYAGLRAKGHAPNLWIARLQWALWILAIGGIYHAYARGWFGGREYWEFPPQWAVPVMGAWALFLVQIVTAVRKIRRWPVYIWMWLTGGLFFLFAFIENYLWLLPYFREHIVGDMTIQWKSNGSLVGAWNQLLYGAAFYLMERIGKDRAAGRSKMAFAMYFLGLSNLMFNWGHHIYPLPTAPHVRYIGYLVSMTEWVFLLRIIHSWKQSLSAAQRHYHYFPYRFLMAADIWVFFSLAQAIVMSVPALNLYTHGTHVTVAHAMGTTIGINSMILMAAGFAAVGPPATPVHPARWLGIAFWTTQGALLVFWVSLNWAGVLKGFWQMSAQQAPFSQLMHGLRPLFVVFAGAGLVLAISLGALGVALMRTTLTKTVRPDLNNIEKTS